MSFAPDPPTTHSEGPVNTTAVKLCRASCAGCHFAHAIYSRRKDELQPRRCGFGHQAELVKPGRYQISGSWELSVTKASLGWLIKRKLALQGCGEDSVRVVGFEGLTPPEKW